MTTLKCRYGDFSIPEQNDLIFNALREYGEWAQEELNLLSRFVCPGDTVLDAGAFIGTHTRAFSQMVGARGSVHAFEPNEQSYCELLKNIQLAPYSNITAYQIALGSNRRPRHLVQDVLMNIGSSRLSEEGGDVDAITVEVRSLDEINFSRIDFIKADIEGMEYDLVVGGMRTISQHMPVVFLEANSLQAAGRILDFAHEMEYVVFGHVSRAFNPDNFNRSTSNIFGEAKECSLLLIYRDQLDRWQDTLSSLKLPIIKTLDNLALLLLNKPQYIHEILGGAGVFEQIASRQVVIERAKAVAEELAYSRLAELGRTEQAKAIAEELAYSRLAELERTEQAKTIAEELAYSRLAKLEQLRTSKGYKLLTILRMAPKIGE